MTSAAETVPCADCGHLFGPHATFTLGEHVFDGGVVVCNVPGCPCVVAWTLGGRSPSLPNEETLSRLRQLAQGQRQWEDA